MPTNKYHDKKLSHEDCDEITLEELDYVRKGLTSEMVAAVAKICSNGDLMYGGKKMPVVRVRLFLYARIVRFKRGCAG